MRRPWLLPFVPVYAAGLAWRDLRLSRGWEKVRRLRLPVISIGGLSAGGSGKTPVVIALAKALAAQGLAVDILSRGYGRLGERPVRVDASGTAEEFGDEPLLIARQTGDPVYVAPARFDAGSLAEADEGKESAAAVGGEAERETAPRVHLLDDGFQHRQLFRAIDILLLDRSDLEDSLLPGGNLRERLHAMLRASVLVLPAGDPEIEAEVRRRGWSGPVWRVQRRVAVPSFPGPAVAFCGIARPEQFFSALVAGGARLTRRVAFPDHFRYGARDLRALDAAVGHSGARVLITTEKDRVRLGNLATVHPLLTASLGIEIEEEQRVLEWLMARLEDGSRV